MNTDALVVRLASDVKSVSRWTVATRLSLGIVAGAVVTLILVWVGLGFRTDLGFAMRRPEFWIKWGYTVSLGLAAVALVARLARPEPVSLVRFWPMAIPCVLLGLLSASEMAHVPTADWLAMWLGDTWKTCPWLVLMLSVPIFAGLLWSFRRLAPTQLHTAGAAAGLAAGTWAAAVYCLHCPEASAVFVLTWYTLGIGLAGAAGAMLGPWLLRW